MTYIALNLAMNFLSPCLEDHSLSMLPCAENCADPNLKFTNGWSYRGLGCKFSQVFIKKKKKKSMHTTTLCCYISGTYNQRTQYTYEAEINSVHNMEFNYRCGENTVSY